MTTPEAAATPAPASRRSARPSGSQPDAPSPPRLTVVAVLGDVLRVIRARPVAVLLIGVLFCAIPHALTATTQHWYLSVFAQIRSNQMAISAFSYAVHTPFSVFAAGGCVLVAASVLEPRAPRPTMIEAVRRYAPPMFILQLLLSALAYAVSWLRVIAPPQLATLVNIVVDALFFVAAPILMLENRTPSDALVRSVMRMSRYILRILLIITLTCAPVWLSYGAMAHYPRWARTDADFYIFVALRAAVDGLLFVLFWLAIPAVYFRLQPSGLLAETTAEVFD